MLDSDVQINAFFGKLTCPVLAGTNALAVETHGLRTEFASGAAAIRNRPVAVQTPITGKNLAQAREVNARDAAREIDKAHVAFADGDWCPRQTATWGYVPKSPLILT
ncbi:hypothetical protein MTX26_27455 [Bradyrhizobium sp. ISRA443]|uniref:hypothetical protein n=1 Tax=unclassified Bradyrhizobium TaxID=2631580 RepID=UPI002479FC3B|nr:MULTISPECIES: hypothetical protein [unclassified Bradyrhizobium]WGR93459.1 hypothetical protein MTX20_02290 [Bradyrhizobium sp. ISRA435]WGR98008.1 hypothetical protein MTX23_27445 [Bradyrhizobium sp. ISRA436]WGS04898.1 hypothetical protein MTX18_27455 [Bradyrhizobium sp. ISRA437]WGS11781.1 hypothetical protein MTX26_27455 [Bradyrhizobium sp. ISRA443]